MPYVATFLRIAHFILTTYPDKAINLVYKTESIETIAILYVHALCPSPRIAHFN